MALYIGLDCGWERFRYEVQNGRGRRVDAGWRESNPAELRELLSEYKSERKVTVAFEACAGLYWMDDVVRELGMRSHPFHATAYKVIVESKKKTDKVDAKKIAEGARKDILPERVVVPQKKERKLRQLVSERETYHKELTRWACRLRAHAVKSGSVLYVRLLTRSERSWEEALEELEGRGREVVMRMYRSVLPLFQHLEEVEEEIKELLGDKELAEASRVLETYPGIGPITAAAILAWTGADASRFVGGREAASYFGLVGSTYKSGKLERGGHITKEGPPIPRRLLVQAAWAFLSSKEGMESEWGKWFCRVARKRGKKIAIVGLARKLLTAAVASLRTGKEWNPEVLVRKKSAVA